MEQAGGDRIRRLVDLGQREPPELDRALALARVVRRLGREAQDIEPGHAGRGRGVGNAVPEIDRPLGLARRVGVGVDRGRGIREAAIEATSASGRRPAANQWWASSLGVPAAARHRDRRRTASRDLLVESPSLAREQLARDRLGEQGMAEPVVPVRSSTSRTWRWIVSRIAASSSSGGDPVTSARSESSVAGRRRRRS